MRLIQKLLRAGVSIHAPARGATTSSRTGTPSRSSFNPRAREGRDGSKALKVKPRRCFNPRAREGRDGQG